MCEVGERGQGGREAGQEVVRQVQQEEAGGQRGEAVVRERDEVRGPQVELPDTGGRGEEVFRKEGHVGLGDEDGVEGDVPVESEAAADL